MPAAFDRDQLRAIAGGARTLHERLADPSAVESSGRDQNEVEAVLEAWREQFPNDEAFDRRLDRDGLTEADCRRAIAADRLVAAEPMPAWVEQLDDVVAWVLAADPADQPERLGPRRTVDGSVDANDGHEPDADENGPDADENGPDAERERVFAPLSAAIASCACDRLPDDPVRDALSEPVVGRLAEWFRDRFDRRFQRVLYVEFKTFVAAHDRELAFADPDDFDDPPTAHYEAFVEYLFSGGVVELCENYPVLARLLVAQVRQFDERLREFVRRLDADRAALAERFADGDELGAVTDVEPLANDTHGDGRAVMRVAFESGVSVVYKPRSVDAGVAFYGLVDRLNDHLAAPDLATPAYLARDGYGWMEWVEEGDPADEAAVGRYYRRAGALTCVAYLLEFSDCQHENLVVAGEQPTLVDAETVLHPFVESDRRPSRTDVSALTDDSVLLTLLLPYGIRDAHGSGTELPRTVAGVGLSADEAEIEDYQVPRVKAVGTDVMAVEYEQVRIDRQGNVPSVDGTPHPPGEYVEEFVEGFESAYGTVLDLRETGGLSDLGFPDALAGVENRVVYRATMRYGAVTRSLASWDSLADGARFGVEMESLAVPFYDGTVAESGPWELYEAERRVLARLDPPRLTCRTDDTAIRLGDEATGVEADRTGVERARERIAAASPADARAQVELIRNCFGKVPSPRPSSDSTDPRTASDDELRDEAVALFERVRGAALETADGGRHWASVEPVLGEDGPEPLTVQPARGSLYTGRPGIALFGAALYRVTGEDRYREFALTALGSLREAVRSGRDGPALRSPGGTAGVGGVAYGLGAVGDLVGDDDLLAAAAATADAVTDDLLAADETYDVIGGSAGTILGLLAVHDRRDDHALLSAAVDCGDHLLDGRVEVDGGVRTWRTLDDCPPLTGFAHGASGIAYALVRLADAAGDDRYRDAALEALAYEDDAYSEVVGNWPDLREWSDDHQDQWCHGRSGIGLARLGMADYVGGGSEPLVERGIERAIDGFPDAGLSTNDHLCCGNAGQAAFLLEAERRRGRRAGAARALLGGALARKRETGSYRTLTFTEEVVDPTLFHGLSGIGYAMLSVTEPDDLPCLLLWE